MSFAEPADAPNPAMAPPSRSNASGAGSVILIVRAARYADVELIALCPERAPSEGRNGSRVHFLPLNSRVSLVAGVVCGVSRFHPCRGRIHRVQAARNTHWCILRTLPMFDSGFLAFVPAPRRGCPRDPAL